MKPSPTAAPVNIKPMRITMTLKEAVNVALRANDAKLACSIAERIRHGNVRVGGQPVIFTYNDMLSFVARCTGRDVSEVGPEWEALLAEGDGSVVRGWR